MSRFRPARSSPPLKPSLKNPAVAVAAANSILNESQSSATSVVPELIGLSPEDVEFIDTVILKAGDSATTFLTIFKAYNDTLQERGIDPQHEVVYYGKLLKLGTLKGRNWGHKWDMVKKQQGYDSTVQPKSRPNPPPTPAPSAPPARPASNRAKILTRLTGALKAIEKDDDAFTIHSHQDDVESVDGTTAAPDSTFKTPARMGHRPSVSRRPASPTFTVTTNSLGLSTEPPPTVQPTRISTPAYKMRRPNPPRTPAVWDAEASEATTSTTQLPHSVPPSYNAAARENTMPGRTSYTPLRALAQAHSKASTSVSQASTPIAVPPSARTAVLQARERKGSVINEDDAWKKIQMERDEKEADQFREDRLVERCWEVWKQGLQWIITTNEQIAQARDNLIVRIALHKWRTMTAQRRELHQRVATLSDNRCLKGALDLWRVRLKERRQVQWRQDMRTRMKTVRDNHDLKLKKDAWAKWRQSHRSHIAEQHFSEKLVLRIYSKWRNKLTKLDRLENGADQLAKLKGKSQMEKCWDLWRKAIEMRKAERAMAERVELRILAGVMDVWKRRLHVHQLADDVNDRLVLKHTLRRWQNAQHHVRTLELRAEKYRSRQNDVLIRAVWRVWKAHERGKLLERVRNARLLKQSWTIWTQRLVQQRRDEALALSFSLRASSTLAQGSLQKWKQVHRSHQNALQYAIRYNSSQLQFNALLIWRLQLRAKLKLVKQAKMAAKYFAMRNAWQQWQAKMAERKREHKLKVFEARILRTFLHKWMDRTQSQRQLKLSEQIISERVNMRIMSTALVHWTNRVADLKFRELEVSANYDKKVTGSAFKKWKDLCIRHVEELSLMESYQDVKREENMRRMFYRWLAAARKVRHRRLLLQQKEEEMKLTVVAGAWDKWRERYLDLRLQPLADAFIVQRQQNLVFRTFGIWHSKTNTLPAVRFHASHLKAKVWKIWREAMPRAMQSKEARDMDRKAVLTRAFEKWMQAYKTKIELKAVARARYLRLPTGVPRQSGVSSRPLSVPKITTTSSASEKTLVRPESPTTAAGDLATEKPTKLTTGLYRGKLGIASLLSERSRSPERRSRPRLSAASPTRPKLSTRTSTVRDLSPGAETTTSYGYTRRRPEPFPRSSAPPSTAGDPEVGRGKLWQELRGLQLRSRAPTEVSLPRSRGLP